MNATRIFNTLPSFNLSCMLKFDRNFIPMSFKLIWWNRCRERFSYSCYRYLLGLKLVSSARKKSGVIKKKINRSVRELKWFWGLLEQFQDYIAAVRRVKCWCSTLLIYKSVIAFRILCCPFVLSFIARCNDNVGVEKEM